MDLDTANHQRQRPLRLIEEGMGDAQVFVPFIVAAYDNATTSANPALAAFSADVDLAQAVDRLRHWDLTTPTGLAQGYDGDPNGGGIDASVAASIFSVWCGRFSANSLDAVLDGLGLAQVPRPTRREETVTALRHLLERPQPGIGVSGLNFFVVQVFRTSEYFIKLKLR